MLILNVFVSEEEVLNFGAVFAAFACSSAQGKVLVNPLPTGGGSGEAQREARFGGRTKGAKSRGLGARFGVRAPLSSEPTLSTMTFSDLFSSFFSPVHADAPAEPEAAEAPAEDAAPAADDAKEEEEAPAAEEAEEEDEEPEDVRRFYRRVCCLLTTRIGAPVAP